MNVDLQKAARENRSSTTETNNALAALSGVGELQVIQVIVEVRVDQPQELCKSHADVQISTSEDNSRI